MTRVSLHRIVGTAMVFAVLCGIFQPAVSHATTIVNTVSSQVTTGGQNGADGADGKNGEDFGSEKEIDRPRVTQT